MSYIEDVCEEEDTKDFVWDDGSILVNINSEEWP